MSRIVRIASVRSLVRSLAMVVAILGLMVGSALAQTHKSSPFAGAKANTGYVTHTVQGGKNVLTLSDEFKVPDTPDPHWQVVDSKGTVFLLQKLMIKGDKLNKTITLPAFIADVAKVQIWCAWAETNLGEASFSAPVKTY